MPYHWQSNNIKQCGVEDLVLLQKINEQNICENLKKRMQEDFIYTYIGPVLISVNPFKSLSIYSDNQIEQYRGAASYENPPHIFALSDDMYRNMIIDMENHCVIISGESGAGKTVAAKHIMNYVAKVSGGGPLVQRVKEIILESNPLLEAFGNAKTVRNNNSSRFGKYVEIQFSRGGEPIGGKISNFLLEKSRLVWQNTNERSFHIFYQILSTSSPELKETLGLMEASYFYYLSQSGTFSVEGMEDQREFQATNKAMGIMGMTERDQFNVLSLVSAVLHLGNISFIENNNYALVENNDFLEFPAFLLGIDKEYLKSKLTSRVMDSKWGGKTENIEVTLTPEQASHTRDALSKAIYYRLFDYLVETINKAMYNKDQVVNIGILDIYGFEIFENNGFEQFCINYVNEKLQQIFIELTLKTEQEEYLEEGIKWIAIEYFNNKVVCDLIEGRSPPGLFCLLNDVCSAIHAVSEGADQNLLRKLDKGLGFNKHYQSFSGGFNIHHYAGKVQYEVNGFCERNRDVLFTDLILLMQSSDKPFIVKLFPEQINLDKKTRPTTVGSKIKDQANKLVEALMKCTPHYIRCIKPNETKKAKDWEDERVRHQVEYLGLKENIRVRRAGFAYRRQFNKFIIRYAILTKETWPQWTGDEREGVNIIMRSVSMDTDQFQLGKTKVFIKNPESLFLLEETRERKFDFFAKKIQKFFKKWNSQKKFIILKTKASDLVFNKKERRRFSIDRCFVGDYIGIDHKPSLRALLDRREKVEFAYTVNKYDRRFRVVKRDMIITNKHFYLIGMEKMSKGPQKGQFIEVIKRKIPLSEIESISLTTRQDDFFVLNVLNEYSSLLECTFKTEMLTVLDKLFNNLALNKLKLSFSDNIEFITKKDSFLGSKKLILFSTHGPSNKSSLKSSGKVLTVSIATGLPKDSRPSQVDKYKRNPSNHGYQGKRGVPSNQPRKSKTNKMSKETDRPLLAPPTNSPPHPPIASQALNNQFARQISSENKAPPIPKNNSGKNPKIKNISRNKNNNNNEFLKTPDPGFSGYQRNSLLNSNHGKNPKLTIKPKPKVKPIVENYPKCRSIYDYEAQDVDELSFKEGEIILIIKEDESGWWSGRKSGKQGLFPSNYIEKI